MASEMDELLHRLQQLNRSAREPGQLSSAQLESEVKTVTARLEAALKRSGLPVQKPQEKEQLANQMKSLKWGFVRT